MELCVYEDCWTLVQRFHRKVNDGASSEFEVFCSCWSEMQMQHLFTGQSNNIEVIGTTLAALHMAKRLACSRRTTGDIFQASRTLRIAGFYLLYVIYNKQPTHQFVKIEVSPRTWQELTDYALRLRQERPDAKDTQQVAYMFWRLVQEQAFKFTALDYYQGLDGLVDYDRLECSAGAKRQKQSTAQMKQQRPNNVSLSYELEGLRELHLASQPLCTLESAYNAQKQQLSGQEQALPPTNIFGQLREVFGEIQHLLGNGSQQEAGDEDQPRTSAKNQLEVRQQVRFKAMYGEQKKDEHQAEELEVELEVNEAYQRRMSSATVFQQPLPEDVQREYVIEEYSDEEEDDENEEEITEKAVKEP